MLGIYTIFIQPFSQEVFGPTTCGRWNMPLILCNGRKDGEFGIEALIEIHDRGDITTSIAVIGSAPDSDYCLVFEMPLREC